MLRSLQPVIIMSHLLLDITVCYPLKVGDLQPTCKHKERLYERDGMIIVEKNLKEKLSCSWIIHVPRGSLVNLEFSKLHVHDFCAGTCQCNYLRVEVHSRTGNRRKHGKYCNERAPPPELVFEARKVRMHLNVMPGGIANKTSFIMKYAIRSLKFSNPKRENLLHRMENKSRRRSKNINLNMLLTRAQAVHQSESSKNLSITSQHPKTIDTQSFKKLHKETFDIRAKKEIPNQKTTNAMRTAEPTKIPESSKLVILLAIAIPVVVIFIFVVLLIACYFYKADMKEKESSEDMRKSGSILNDIIMNSSITLTPMFFLGKARKESSARKERANKLYDDMLENWRIMHDDKRKREKAREESINTWVSYKKQKQRRNIKEETQNNNEAFAMLVSSAINVTTKAGHASQEIKTVDKPEIEDIPEKIEEKPRTSSTFLKGDSTGNDYNRGSKVRSWKDITMKTPVEKTNEVEKQNMSETELKTWGSWGSDHVPAIIVSQPSVDTEDEESEPDDTERLIKEKKRSSIDKTSEEDKNSKQKTSSDQVKEILRANYADEMEEWFQKP